MQRRVLLVGAAALLVGRQSATYRSPATFGIEKRDTLTDPVESARDAQDAASERFALLLEQFRATISLDGGDVEQVHDRLDRECSRSVDDAERVRDRIDAIRSVAEDLFEESQEALEARESEDLRARSIQSKRDASSRNVRMLGAMERAGSTKDRLLQTFEDRVLSLEDNLQARAISAMPAELEGIDSKLSRMARKPRSTP